MSGQTSEVRIRVVPGVKDEGVTELSDGRLEVRVKAAAKDGKANARVQDLLSFYYEVDPKRVIIVAGHNSPYKRVRITH